MSDAGSKYQRRWFESRGAAAQHEGDDPCLAAILQKPTDLEPVRSLVTEDVTYVSLNYDNPDLQSIMPWCATHDRAGPESIVKTFLDVRALLGGAVFPAGGGFRLGRIRGHVRPLQLQIDGDFQSGELAVRHLRQGQGRATISSSWRTRSATGASFRSGGKWTFRSDPDGQDVTF